MTELSCLLQRTGKVMFLMFHLIRRVFSLFTELRAPVVPSEKENHFIVASFLLFSVLTCNTKPV